MYAFLICHLHDADDEAADEPRNKQNILVV